MELKSVLISLCLLLTGCASKGINATLFLKEDDSRIYNLKGDDCLISGYQVIKAPDGQRYRLTTYFSNCDVHTDRLLKEFELKDWGIQPKKKGSVGLQ